MRQLVPDGRSGSTPGALTDSNLPLGARGARKVVHDVGRFVLRPSLPAAKIGPGRACAFVFAILLTLDFTLAGGAIALETFATEAGYEPPAYVDSEWSLGWELAALVLFAPLIEEAIFRGWLAGTRAWLRFGLHMAIVVVLLTLAAVSVDVLPGAILAFITLFALGLAIFAALRVRDRRHEEPQVPGWFRSNFRWFVWGSTLAFGAVHLSNFEGVSSPLDALLILSQTAGALLLAYTRVHLGLRAAIAQHAVFNAVFAALSLAVDGSL